MKNLHRNHVIDYITVSNDNTIDVSKDVSTDVANDVSIVRLDIMFLLSTAKLECICC